MCPIQCFRSYIWFLIVAIISVFILVLSQNQSVFMAINSLGFDIPYMLLQFFNALSAPSHFILPIILILSTYIFSRQNIYKIVFILITYYAVFALLKHSVHEVRPYVAMSINIFYFLPDGDTVKSAYQSFPSGHVGLAAVFAFSISRLYFAKNRLMQLICLLFVVVIGLVRVISGWHWPLDVLCAGMLGYIIVTLFLRSTKTCSVS